MAPAPAPSNATANPWTSLAKALARPLATALALAMATAGCSPVGATWLTPTDEAAPFLADAIAQWVAAGVPAEALVIGPRGAPVEVTAEPPSGSRGQTLMYGDRVGWVKVWVEAPARTWTHEVGHVLGVTDHGGCVMASPSECADITAKDLALAGW